MFYKSPGFGKGTGFFVNTSRHGSRHRKAQMKYFAGPKYASSGQNSLWNMVRRGGRDRNALS